MNERTVTLSLKDYNELVSKTAVLAVIERMANSGYVSTEDIKRIIGTESE